METSIIIQALELETSLVDLKKYLYDFKKYKSNY